MKMQESTFSVAAGAGSESEPNANSFRLSGLSSEWLFSSDFWRDLNVEIGTIFDQFEEDEVDSSVTEKVANYLWKRIDMLIVNPIYKIEFVRGWTSSNEPLIEAVERDQLIFELKGLHTFLVESLVRPQRVLFSL